MIIFTYILTSWNELCLLSQAERTLFLISVRKSVAGEISRAQYTVPCEMQTTNVAQPRRNHQFFVRFKQNFSGSNGNIQYQKITQNQHLKHYPMILKIQLLKFGIFSHKIRYLAEFSVHLNKKIEIPIKSSALLLIKHRYFFSGHPMSFISKWPLKLQIYKQEENH